MAKYLILYNSTDSATELMANASPEQMKDSMDEWIKWRDEAGKTAKFDFGMPLQAAGRVTTDGSGDSDNSASGYSIIEGDSKDAIIELLLTHPHLKRAGASIDLLEMMAMPGLEP
jgi:hypothetical protein